MKTTSWKTALGICLVIVALFAWAHLGALLEVPGSYFLRAIALAAAISTTYLGLVNLWDARQARKKAREHAELCKLRTRWPQT